jgi:hypothetical protein
VEGKRHKNNNNTGRVRRTPQDGIQKTNSSKHKNKKPVGKKTKELSTKSSMGREINERLWGCRFILANKTPPITFVSVVCIPTILVAIVFFKAQFSLQTTILLFYPEKPYVQKDYETYDHAKT